MRYIDLDGVILDTEDIIFNKLLFDCSNLTEEFIFPFVVNVNWAYVLEYAKDINDSINILKSMNPKESAILTRVHSNQEADAKINYFKSIDVKQEVIPVFYPYKKNDIVNAKDNILIDDSLRNLRQWVMDGGYPMFFDKKENGIDSWDEYNVNNFQKVLRIDEKKK